MTRHRPRIYLTKISEDFILPNDKAHHLVSVFRMKPGDEFLAFNEIDGEWLCRIKDKTTAERIKLIREPTNNFSFAIAFCLIKPDNMKLIIEKCTELGASDFYPLISRYTQTRNFNINKMRIIAELASEQAERMILPTIHNVLNLAEFLNKLPEKFKWYSAIERNINNLNKKYSDKTGFIIGPEGGFADAEKDLLISKTTPISLGNYILRSETACIKAASLIF